ncbi:hypothetical protein ALC57_10101, partial [Trachymyrmex cornetzi]
FALRICFHAVDVELERCPIGEGDGKAGIGNGSFDIEEKRSGRSKEGRGARENGTERRRGGWGRQTGRQARDAGMMANGCIARARRRDTDASPSGAKAKTAEWNYSCSIVYNGRINGLNRRRTTRSLFVIAQRSAAAESQRSVRMSEVAREKSRRSYCILTIFFGVYEPNIEEKLHPLMSQASWSLVTTGDDGAHAYRHHLKAIGLPNLPSSVVKYLNNLFKISTGNLVKIKIKQRIEKTFMYRKYNDLTALSAPNVPMPQTRPRLSHKGEPANRWRRETSNFVFRFSKRETYTLRQQLKKLHNI